MHTHTRGFRQHAAAHRQRGLIATLLAIIVLVATLLAAVALMRSLDTSNVIAGSVAFRQGAIQESERAYTEVKNTMNFNEPISDADGVIPGYHAELLQSTSPASKGLPDILVQQATSSTQVAGVSLPMAVLPSTMNQVFYVLERVCPSAGPADPTKCSVPGATITGGSMSGQTSDKGAPFNSGSNASFRLSVLVKGPKNIVAYTQTILR